MKEMLEAQVKAGLRVNDLLREAGMRVDFVQDNRAFQSRWAWNDGTTVVATVWLHEMSDVGTTLRAHRKQNRTVSGVSL